jgi:uncharacterized membrane protein (UPF0127 family)
MKKYVFISVGVALLGVVFVLFITLIALRTSGPVVQEVAKKEDLKGGDFRILAVRGFEIKAEVVTTPEKRNKGLSGREVLARDEGMLFVFEDADTYAFWMPDMHFSLDIIWLDENMKVVHIQENATPESYPELFTPPIPALYVLEVRSGFSKEKGIVVGDQVVIQ